jgi:hypothetical protein
MSGQLVVRPHRKHRRDPVALLAVSRPALAGGGAGLAATMPTLTMYEPEDRHATLVGGSIVTLIHLGFLAALVLVAMLAPPELIEKVIPLEIISVPEPTPLPGSNAEPAPAGPKAVGASRPSAAALAAAQTLSPEQAEALRQAAIEAARRTVQQMELDAQRQQTVLPTQIARREVQADSRAALAAAIASPSMAVDMQDLESVEIDPAELAALDIDLSGPRQIETTSLTNLSTPQAFEILAELGESDYSGSVQASQVAASGSYDLSSLGRSGVDTGLGAAYGGYPGGSGSGEGGSRGGGEGYGTGTGGHGTSLGTVRCLDSAYVQRYLDMVERRTIKRWSVPEGVAPGAEVILRFRLDPAGMTNNVDVVKVADEALGESAMQALQSAAPFPPMDDNNRCLTAKPIIGTFKVPSR